ncbi:MAG: flagellar motor protein MotB [Gammaproteobacteria bacterium]|nr:flagellar motor protein MotB [Gammaproteobacteria bacterium]
MSDPTLRPIVVKRIKKAAHGHHGGAWKIAYADFVTAMMAFFLLMWLLGVASKEQLKGISEYFQTPLKVALFGGEGYGDSSSVIKGGGMDPTKSVGQDNQRDLVVPPPEAPPDVGAPAPMVTAPPPPPGEAEERALEQREGVRLEALKTELVKAIDADPLLEQFRHQILLDIVSEGLRVQIVDEKNRPMFSSGSAQLQPHTRSILREVGRVLNQVPNRISLAGHTDARPYAGGERGYSNWELSADRANASRRELVAGGMTDDKIMRVVGLGSAVPMDTADPFTATNRRISIVVLKRKAEEAVRSESGPAPQPDPVDTPPEATEPPGVAGLSSPIGSPITLPARP